MNYDIIIAGAGPVGLSLALRLAKAHKRVLVLEKKPTTHEHSRAPAIWPRTQEILSDLGVINTFLEQGIVMSELSLWDADKQKTLLHIPLKEAAHITQFPHLLIIPQSRTERLLAQAVEQTESADLRFSSELTGFTQDASSVTVEYTENGETHTAVAQFLVGCDGAHSAVRELLGVHLEGETYSMQAALADIELETDMHFPAISTNGVIVVAIKIDTKLWRLILLHARKDEMPLEERIVQAAKQLFPGMTYKNIWSSEFRLHNRISTRFVDGRIALAGDAAHLNSPVGGQGMNAGIQDTEILGNALLSALEDKKPSELEAYGKRRSAVLQSGVNRFTDLLTDFLFFGKGRLLKYVILAWNLCIKIPFVRRRFIKKVTMLD